jgi:cytochrome c oxidase subunit 2
MTRGARTFRLTAAAALLLLGATAAFVAAQPAERVIRVTTKKFEFKPDHLTLKKGEPVVLEFVAEDVVMGWNLSDFGLRSDIIPGKAMRVRFVPDRTGEFTFFCDIFCGTGHEEMSGSIKIVN